MPVFVYIILGIALLIALILLCKIKLFICYEDSLTVYAQVLFLKFKLIPKISLKPKKKKAKRKKKGSAPPPAPAKTEAKATKKEKSIATKLWEIKEVLLSIIERGCGKLHFRFIKLKILIGCDNACITALAYAGVSQAVSYIIDILRNLSNVDMEKSSDVSVESDFISQKSEFGCKIELYVRVISIISIGIFALKEYIKSKTED